MNAFFFILPLTHDVLGLKRLNLDFKGIHLLKSLKHHITIILRGLRGPLNSRLIYRQSLTANVHFVSVHTEFFFIPVKSTEIRLYSSFTGRI